MVRAHRIKEWMLDKEKQFVMYLQAQRKVTIPLLNIRADEDSKDSLDAVSSQLHDCESLEEAYA